MEIEKEQWSEEFDQKIALMRRELTSLMLHHCNLSLKSVFQQEQIDESRDLNDRVSSSVTKSEDKATRQERKQTLQELNHAVDEFAMDEREEDEKTKRK